MSAVPTAKPVVLGRETPAGNIPSLHAVPATGQPLKYRPHELIRTDDGRVYHWSTSAMEIVSAPVHHGTVADVASLSGIYLLPTCTRGVHPGDTAYVTAAACEYRVTSGINATAVWSACASIPTSANSIGADPSGTAAAAVSAHNTAAGAHADIRSALGGKQDALDISAAGTSLLNITTPDTQKIPRINTDSTITLIDVPSGGGGGGVTWSSVGSTSAPTGGEYLYAQTTHTMDIDSLSPGTASAVVVIHHEGSLEVRLSSYAVRVISAPGVSTIRRRADGVALVGTVGLVISQPSYLLTYFGDSLTVDLDCLDLLEVDSAVMSAIPAVSGLSWPVNSGSPVASTTGGRRGVYFGASGSAGGVVIPPEAYTIALVASWDGVGGYARSLNGAASNWLLGPYGAAWQLYGGSFTNFRSAVSGALMVIVLSRTSSGTTIRYLAADGTTIAGATAPAGSLPGALYVGTGGVYADPARSHIHQIGVWSRALGADELAAVAAGLRDRWS